MKKNDIFKFGKRASGASVEWKVLREFEMHGHHMVEAVSTQPLVFFGSTHIKEAIEEAKNNSRSNAEYFLCKTFSEAMGHKIFCLDEQEKIYHGRQLCYGTAHANDDKTLFDIASGSEILNGISDIKTAKGNEHNVLIAGLSNDVYSYYNDTISQFEISSCDDFKLSSKRYCVFCTIKIIDEERK